MAVNVNKVYTR